MYKIYINECVLVLAKSFENGLKSYNTLQSKDFNFQQFYNKVKLQAEPSLYVVETSNYKKLFQDIKLSVKIIKAAGGIVSNEENKYLFIFRKGKWDLPKGKIDSGEKTKVAAVREVEEECGIKVTSAGKKTCKTYHVYEMGGKVILKKTTWYKMRADNQPNLVPQLEEDITEAKWLSIADFQLVNENTYPLIKEVMTFIEV
ncbi:MAG: hydrolase [Daejeonella sp.]|nr:hydrolase [Daejeonella sp.]